MIIMFKCFGFKQKIEQQIFLGLNFQEKLSSFWNPYWIF